MKLSAEGRGEALPPSAKRPDTNKPSTRKEKPMALCVCINAKGETGRQTGKAKKPTFCCLILDGLVGRCLEACLAVKMK